jgi:small-conductance mechanosensitive channel
VKTLRKIVAENESLKAECEELRRQCTEWKNSANNWQSLYEKEKFRADEILTQSNKNFEEAVKTQKFALNLQREQLLADRDYINSLEHKVKSLRKSSLRNSVISFGGGAAIGGFLGFKLARLNI